MQNIIKFLTLFVVFAIVGCGASVPTVKPYKMDIQQGNVVTSEMLLKLRPGMTKSQVQYIMGTPLLVDSFHSNRWDYFYQLRKQGKVVNQRRVILDFDGDSLAKVRGDVVPEGTDIDALMQQAKKPKAEPAIEAPSDVDVAVEKIETPDIESAVAAEPVKEAVAEPVKPLAEVVDAEVESVVEKPVESMDVPTEDVLLDPVPEVVAEEVEPLSAVVEAKQLDPADVAPVEATKEEAAAVVEPVEEEVVEAVEAVKEVEPVVELEEAVEAVAPPEVEVAKPTVVKPKASMIPAPPVMGPAAKPRAPKVMPIKKPVVEPVPAPAPVVEASEPVEVEDVEVKVPESEVVEKAEEAVKEAPVVTAPNKTAPNKEVVKIPAAPTPSSGNLSDDWSLFKFDRELDPKRIKAPVVEPEVSASEVETAKPPAPESNALPKEESGIFERTLEFIGF